MKVKTNKLILMCLVIFLIIISVAVTFSFFTSHNTKVNTFVTGEVQIKVTEPLYNNPENVEKRKNISPGQSIIKDPFVINSGVSDCYVFVTVNIPRSKRLTVDNGKLENNSEEKDMFYFTPGDNWTIYKEVIHEDIKNPYKTYVLYYGKDSYMTSLKSGKISDCIFKDNRINLGNIIEKSNEEDFDIHIKAYGIQTTDIIKTENGFFTDNGIKPCFVESAIINQLKNENRWEGWK